jgi:hypothetical protein
MTNVPADIKIRIMATSLAVIDFLMKGSCPQRKVVHRDYINYFSKGLFSEIEVNIFKTAIRMGKNFIYSGNVDGKWSFYLPVHHP